MNNSDEKRALDLTESAREQVWKHPSFVGEMFMGNFRKELVFPFPEQSESDKKAGDEILEKIRPVLENELDADELDATGKFPPKVITSFKKLGLFGIKIPKKYGGLGLSQYNYGRIIELISSHCGSTAVFLSAHQSIGVPQPLKLFGTEEQKQKYLPRLCNGAISAFALTEPDVGSDPSKMTTTATPTEDGKHFLITGRKLWISNGPIADILIVMARTPTNNPEKTKVTAFLVEKSMAGFTVEHRCRFLGLNGLENGLLSFKDVKVPRENILLGEGEELKLALVTLNTGRLTLPAGSSGVAKQCLAIVRKWANERHQWGAPIGKHEAVAEKIARITADTFAIESVAWLTSSMADEGNVDIRLEAAMAKLFTTERLWSIIDDTLQIRGGRGYERATSLRDRGEEAMPVERMLRDARINTIIEGTTDIMHLFIAREALDPHMKIAKVSPLTGEMDLKGAAKHYMKWYPKLWVLSRPVPEKYKMSGNLYKHTKYVERKTRSIARTIFHAMVMYKAKLEKKQRVLGRIVDIGAELFAMVAVISRSQMLFEKNRSDSTPLDLADAFCNRARRKICRLMSDVYCNDDKTEYKLAKRFLNNEFAWLEDGIISTWKNETKKAKPISKAAPKKVAAKPAVKKAAAKLPAKRVEAKPPAKRVEAKPPAKRVEAKPPAKKAATKPAKKVTKKKDPKKEK